MRRASFVAAATGKGIEETEDTVTLHPVMRPASAGEAQTALTNLFMENSRPQYLRHSRPAVIPATKPI
jgi:hypothetical protein